MLSERTSAIVVAHIAGEPADMDPIMALAEKHGLPVVDPPTRLCERADARLTTFLGLTTIAIIRDCIFVARRLC